MRKWILLSILAIGMLFLLAGCAGCSLTKVPTPPTAPTAPAAGTCTPTNTDGAETIAIAGATFKMGSLPADPGAKADEQPQHDVTLGCYNMYTKEVTNAQYNKCVATGACVPVQARDNNPTTHINDPAFADYPVVGVDFNMASEYCTWAGGRLPTEAEWEYAARGSKGLAYPWGDQSPACTLANSKGCLSPEDTSKTGSLPAGDSPFKVSDMAGNAWEWVFDWYAEDGYSKSAATDPIGPVAGFWKVVRGGGYNSIPDMLRAANRKNADPYKPYYNVGFRCVADKPLTLPDNYNPPNPNLHQIPMDGPVDDEDHGPSGDQMEWLVSPANCPDENGNLHFAVTILPHPAITLTSFSVDGADFTCTWDDVSQLYQCVGPNSQTANPNYDVKFCAHSDTDGDGCMQGLQRPKPQNCSQGQYPIDIKYFVSCPNGGDIQAFFYTDPVLTWDTTEIDGGIAMNCILDASNELSCNAPDVMTNGQYGFHLHGTDSSQLPYDMYIYANPNPNCPQGNKDFTGILYPECNNGLPYTFYDYISNPPGDPILKVGGFDVALTYIGGGSSQGYLDPSLQGMTVPYEMGIGSTMLGFGTVAVPDCTSASNGQLSVNSLCSANISPALKITYEPATLPVVSMMVNGVDTPWVPDAPGDNSMLYDLPTELWGKLLTVRICIGSDSYCVVSGTLAVNECNPPPTSCSCRLLGVDCLSTTTIGFTVQTCAANPTPLVAQSVTASDNQNTYQCQLTNQVGQVYCGGALPTNPGPLKVCYVAQGSQNEICCTIDNFAGNIPVCYKNCSQYTDSDSCSANHCLWTPPDPSGKPGGGCHQ